MSSDGAASDDELIEAAKSGHTEAFEELYERHAMAVFKYVHARVDDRLKAEDLMEETFLRMWTNLNQTPQNVPVLTFLESLADELVQEDKRGKQGG